ncbi:MAG: GGDEF domain-containing protein [Sandarakinorhabdus sp.]|nr:GGDEF domain-containing protein [Sandarakinorhabdus sp.]
MGGAIYVLIVNASVALLFAVAFAVIRLSYPGQRHVGWFAAVYLLGMLTPLSELGVRFTDQRNFFVAASYGSLLLSTIAMPLGLAALSDRPLPWRAAGAILAGGIATRIAIWDGPRNDLRYEIAYQVPFATATMLAMFVAISVIRHRRSRLWLVVAIVFGFMSAYFFVKPIFASVFGSGSTAAAYSASSYALFSQATGGVLIVTAGLLVLLIVVQTAMSEKTLESESDALTGLSNRRGLERHADRLIDAAQRRRVPLSVVLFDIDHFKRVNDTYGHATGDAVIQSFADLLKATAPPTAAAARVGGEEFVLLLDRTSLQGAWHFAQAIRSALPDGDANLPHITVSGGIAELQPGDTLYTLLERADRWAYAAKRAGRDQIRPEPGEPLQLELVSPVQSVMP